MSRMIPYLVKSLKNREAGNINLNTREKIPNPCGGYAAVNSASYNIDGKEVLLPRSFNNKANNTDEDTVNQYRKTGEHLGKFHTPHQASRYASRPHDNQAEQYGE